MLDVSVYKRFTDLYPSPCVCMFHFTHTKPSPPNPQPSEPSGAQHAHIQLFWELFSGAMQLGSSKQFFGETAITFPRCQLNVLARYSLFNFSYPSLEALSVLGQLICSVSRRLMLSCDLLSVRPVGFLSMWKEDWYQMFLFVCAVKHYNKFSLSEHGMWLISISKFQCNTSYPKSEFKNSVITMPFQILPSSTRLLLVFQFQFFCPIHLHFLYRCRKKHFYLSETHLLDVLEQLLSNFPWGKAFVYHKV